MDNHITMILKCGIHRQNGKRISIIHGKYTCIQVTDRLNNNSDIKCVMAEIEVENVG